MSTKVIRNWDELPLTLTVRDASILLNCSEEHTRQLIKAGVIKAKKISKRCWVIPKSAMYELIEGS